ncbi:peptidase inhibitor family I36 protein [Amycolatopsis thermalba]|uniref:Peptidase inhibitor family I36 protein n=1 Tax=Amycolatopsis thermalba TaxID=944492 RepID=A0ABY4NS72_9PSEU|nr:MULTISPECIES: peptidase inhibitor family I36 protein [Amycolatopsis]UQS22910.1 peptidase inhibitor family I36 protein [Amycolatopsis thermalba]
MRASVFLAVLAIALVPATAAAQGVSPFDGRDCPRGSLCLYRDHGFTGGGLALQPGDRVGDLGTHDLADVVSSWTNDSGVTCTWYESPDFYGRAHEMLDGFRVELPAPEDDTPSSVACA